MFNKIVNALAFAAAFFIVERRSAFAGDQICGDDTEAKAGAVNKTQSNQRIASGGNSRLILLLSQGIF